MYVTKKHEGNSYAYSSLQATSLIIIFVSLLVAQHPQAGQDLLIHEISRSHTMMHHSQ